MAAQVVDAQPQARVGFEATMMTEAMHDAMLMRSQQMLGGQQHPGPDPLVAHLKGDREVARLELDVGRRTHDARLNNCQFFLPCCWPFGGLCWLFLRLPWAVERQTRARRLVLRENSLFYEQDEINANALNGATICSPEYVPAREEVYLLSEVNLDLHTSLMECHRHYTSLRIRVEGGVGLPAVVLAFPSNGTEFLEAFNRQKQRASPPQAPADTLKEHRLRLGGPTAGGALAQLLESSSAASPTGSSESEQLAQLFKLKEQGALSEAEFVAAKQRLLGL